MKIIFTLAFIALTFSNCIHRDDQEQLVGTYAGTFSRSSPNARYAPVAVTITFDGENF